MQPVQSEGLYWVNQLESYAEFISNDPLVPNKAGHTIKLNQPNFSEKEIMGMAIDIFEKLEKDLEEGRIDSPNFDALSSRVGAAAQQVVKSNLEKIKKEREGTRFQRRALRVFSIVTFIFGGFLIHQSLNAEDKNFEQKKLLVRLFDEAKNPEQKKVLIGLFDTIEHGGVEAEDIRKTFAGIKINLLEKEIINPKNEVISVLEAFYVDFPRADFYLEGKLFDRKTPEANLTELRDSFTPQQLKNLTLVLNQAAFAKPLERLYYKIESKDLLPLDGNYIEFRVEKMKKSNLVKLTLITNMKIKDVNDLEGKEKGYISYGADVYISEDELDQDWINKTDVAPKMRVADYFSPMRETPGQAIKFVQQASKISQAFIYLD